MNIKNYIDEQLKLYHDPSFTHSYNATNIGYLKCLEQIKKSIESGYIEL